MTGKTEKAVHVFACLPGATKPNSQMKGNEREKLKPASKAMVQNTPAAHGTDSDAL